MDPRPISVASHLAPGVQPLYEFAARRIGERLGRPAAFTVATSYERCAADVDEVCFVCSVPYLLFSDAGRIEMEVLAAPVLLGSRYQGRPVYFSDVIVRADSDIRHFEDLRGRRWAYNEPFSHSGFIVAWHHLLERGLDPGFFGEVIEAGYHDTAIRLVADGQADAAAIDSQVLDIALAAAPFLRSRLRIIDILGPSTIQPMVASVARLTKEERGVVRDVVVGLADDPTARPILAATGVERFVPLAGADYSDIRRMLGAVREAGWLDGDWQARWTRLAG